MFRNWILLIAVGLLTAALIVGCSDSDCPTCPGGNVLPLGYTYGTLVLDPEAYMDNMEVHGYGAVPPGVDSVKIGDSLVSQSDMDYDYVWDYESCYRRIYYSEGGSVASYMYQHGDTGVVTVWGEGRFSTCRLVLLDTDSASANVISPAYNDTIDAGETVVVHWDRINHVQYYGILLEWRTSVNGDFVWHYDFDYTLDTSYTVTGAMQPDSIDNYFYVNVSPFNGPDPRTGNGNWSGTLLTGRLYSNGSSDNTRIVVRPPAAVQRCTGDVDAAAMDNRKEWTATEVIGRIYKEFE